MSSIPVYIMSSILCFATRLLKPWCIGWYNIGFVTTLLEACDYIESMPNPWFDNLYKHFFTRLSGVNTMLKPSEVIVP